MLLLLPAGCPSDSRLAFHLEYNTKVTHHKGKNLYLVAANRVKKFALKSPVMVVILSIWEGDLSTKPDYESPMN